MKMTAWSAGRTGGWNGGPLAQPASTTVMIAASITWCFTCVLLSRSAASGQLHGLPRALRHVGGHDQRQAGIGEHLFTLLDIGALGAQDHGQREAQRAHGG